MQEIGSCEAIINRIQTTIDGGVRLTLDLNSDDSELIKKLLDIKLMDNRVLFVGFASGEQ